MASDYYNNRDYINDFNQNLSDVKGSIAGKEAEYNQYKGQSDAAYQAQQQAMQNRTSYSDLLSQAKETEGVNQAKQQYQSDVEAVNAINSAMNTLPSSINANSNVVLTNAQRQAALGNQMNKYLNSYDYATRQAETSGGLYQQAQNAAFTAAEAGANEQQQNISNAMNAYSQEMANLQNAYSQLANERSRMFDIYGQKYDEDYRRAQDQLQREMQEKELAMKKYIADQDAAAQRYAADASIRLQDLIGKQQQENANRNNALTYGTGVSSTGVYRDIGSNGQEILGNTDRTIDYVNGVKRITDTAGMGSYSGSPTSSRALNWIDVLFNPISYLNKYGI